MSEMYIHRHSEVEKCTDIKYLSAMQNLYMRESEYIETLLRRDEINTH